MSRTVTVTLPEGDYCMRSAGKFCIFARYTKKWNAYNCKLHNRILKGEQIPRKCKACLEYCERTNGGTDDGPMRSGGAGLE